LTTHSQIAEIARAQVNQPSLNDVLDAERVLAQLDDTSLHQLLPFLPEGQRTVEDLRSQLRSPQVQQTISRLSSILNSSQYGHVMASLGLPQASGFGVSGFIDTIQNEQKKQDSKNTDKAKDSEKRVTTIKRKIRTKKKIRTIRTIRTKIKTIKVREVVQLDLLVPVQRLTSHNIKSNIFLNG